jgi:hypothetical protein
MRNVFRAIFHSGVVVYGLGGGFYHEYRERRPSQVSGGGSARRRPPARESGKLGVFIF